MGWHRGWVETRWAVRKGRRPIGIFVIFSKCALKSLNNQADFDSAIRRFDSSRPSQAVRPSCRYPVRCQKGPPTAGFCIWPPVSRLPIRLFGAPNCRKSPAVFENIPIFRRLRPETWFERHCQAGAAAMPEIHLSIFLDHLIGVR
jgi:hypothetical protein